MCLIIYKLLKKIIKNQIKILAGIHRIEQSLLFNKQKLESMGQELDALTQDVAKETEVDQSAIVLLNGLAAKIDSLKNDPAALTALSEQLRGSSSALADAVAANTPAA